MTDVTGHPGPAGDCALLDADLPPTLPAPHLPVTRADLRKLAEAADTLPGGDDFYDHLFQLEASEAPKCAGWERFFVETLAAHVVWNLRPTGVVNEAQGEWLIRQCGTRPSPTCCQLLTHVQNQAHRVPIWFGAAVKARIEPRHHD
ncbi:MAG: hypothetical protein KGQ37_00595 [Hyphomicrobiales bacterium]|nr:hypothetical protein [Hyphomicrobiales bacterium]